MDSQIYTRGQHHRLQDIEAISIFNQYKNRGFQTQMDCLGFSCALFCRFFLFLLSGQTWDTSVVQHTRDNNQRKRQVLMRHHDSMSTLIYLQKSISMTARSIIKRVRTEKAKGRESYGRVFYTVDWGYFTQKSQIFGGFFTISLVILE